MEYSLNKPEQELFDLLDNYLKKFDKIAFPKMDRYDLTLMLSRSFSSSPWAFEKTLQGVVKRLEKMQAMDDAPQIAQELSEFQTMLKLTQNLAKSAKSEAFLKALKDSLFELKRLGAQTKALIFTENISTQKYLYKLLNQGRYQGRVLLFNGAHSRDYGLMERFKNEAQILIATDIAAEGFSLEFCSLVINYDLPYSALKVEQRLNRCQRQGQHCDVWAINFLNRENFADVRILELINKRLLQFDGIFSLADEWLGDFSRDLAQGLGKILAQARSKAEIDRLFDEILETNKVKNKELVRETEKSLFSSFTKEISQEVIVSPQYLKDKIKEINDNLWRVTKYFFSGKDGYFLDDETRTLKVGIQPQKVFTGSRLGRREYSMTDRSLPKSGWYTISSPLAKNILHEIFWQGIPDRCEIWVEGSLEPCTVGYYQVKIKSANYRWPGDYDINPAVPLAPYQSCGGPRPLRGWDGWRYYVFVGQTESGRLLSDEECREIMALPVVKFTTQGERFGARDGLSKPKAPAALDKLIDPAPFIKETLEDTELAENEEIKRLKAYALEAKIELERRVDLLKHRLKQLEKQASPAADIRERLEAQKQLSGLQTELQQSQDNFFREKMRLEVELEKRIEEIKGQAKLTPTVERVFMAEFRGTNGSN